MTNQQKMIVGVVGVLIVVGLLEWGLTAQRAVPAAGEPIKIGVVASLTGPGSFYGQNIRKGVQLAVDEIHTAGGVNGNLLEAVFEDDVTDSKQVVSAVRKLADVDNVVALIGPQWDFLSNAAIPIINERALVAISPAAAYDSILEENRTSPFYFTTFPSASAATDAVAKFLQREQAKTAVMIAANNDWGAAHLNAYQAAAAQSNVQIVETFRLAQLDNNDLRAELTRIKELRPDAVLLVMNDADNIRFSKRYRELGLDSSVVAHSNIGDPLRTNRLDLQTADQFYFFEYPAPDTSFSERFKEHYNEQPQIAADTAYDAVSVIKQAIEQGDATRQGIAKGIRQVRNFSGVTGPIDFTANNFPERRALLKQVVNQQIIDVN
ncbi:MAG TPA: ABC transporter substrate-binding protein [Methylophilaceae bacterium]|nr:ABC transporter substrate-binding protein [Methylophilaceae bacterium]